jgi:hypothetical protein
MTRLVVRLILVLALLSIGGNAFSQQTPPAPRYEILMSGIDDIGETYFNGTLVDTTRWGRLYKGEGFRRPGYSGWISVDEHLQPGQNEIKFILTNLDYPGGWGGRFRMRYNGKVFFDYQAGQPDSSPGRKITIQFPLDTSNGEPVGFPPVMPEPDLIVLSEGEGDFDYVRVYQLLKAQYDFLVKFFGRKPTQPIVVHVGPDQGGYSNGYDMWLESGRIYDTSHNYAHEMMHCFCRDYGAFPNWLFEQLADIAYCESEIYLWKRKTDADFKNQWVRERSGQLCSLRINYGPRYFPRFFDLIHQDLVSGEYKVRTDSIEHLNMDMTAYLNRAAGENAVVHLNKMGFRMHQE